MTVRWWAPLPLVLLIATGSDARGGTGKYVPAFSLDQIVEQRNLGQFVLSPDRTRVVFTRVGRYFAHPLFPAFGEDSNLTLLRLATGEQVQLTSGTAAKTYPSFSPDGRFVATNPKATSGRCRSNGHGRGASRPSAGADRGAAWSPDGRRDCVHPNRLGRAGIYVMERSGEREGLRTSHARTTSAAPIRCGRPMAPSSSSPRRRATSTSIHAAIYRSPAPGGGHR